MSLWHSSPGVGSLPEEVVLNIMAFTVPSLPDRRAKELLRLGEVNGHWRHCSMSDRLWEAVFENAQRQPFASSNIYKDYRNEYVRFFKTQYTRRLMWCVKLIHTNKHFHTHHRKRFLKAREITGYGSGWVVYVLLGLFLALMSHAISHPSSYTPQSWCLIFIPLFIALLISPLATIAGSYCVSRAALQM